MNYLRDTMIQNCFKSLRMNGVDDILQKMYFEIKKRKGRGISKFYMQYFKIGRRTMYGWLNGKSPIPIFQFLKFVELWEIFCKKYNSKEIVDLTFTRCRYFSVAKGRKVKLPIQMTTDLAYLIGYIIGDGCLSGNNLIKRSQFRIRIASDTKQFLEQTINLLFTSLFSIKGKMYKVSNSRCYEYSVQSKVLYLFFNKICDIPMGKKKGKLIIPKIISNSSKKVKFAFVSGFFDADGCIFEKQKFISFTQADRGFLIDLSNLLENLGINTRPIYATKKEWGITYTLSIRFRALRSFLDNVKVVHPDRIRRTNNLRDILTMENLEFGYYK